MTYSDKLKDPRWQKKRLQILERDNWACVKCTDKESTLCVHHLKYHGNPWESDNKDLVTLCEDCHEAVEALKNDCDLDKMKMLKLTSTDDGGLILFTSHNGICSMVIKHNKTIKGHNFGAKTTIKGIIDIFTHTQDHFNEKL